MTEKKDFIVVQSTDLLPDADTTLEHGIVFARETKGQLISLHLHQGDPDGPLPDLKKTLEKWSTDGEDLNHKTVVHDTGDSPKKGLLKSIKEFDADLLIVGTRQQNANKKTKTSRNSVSEVAALDADVPTLVLHLGQPGLVNAEGELQLRRVLVPVGDGEEARDAIQGITKLLDRVGVDDVDLFLLRVGDDEILEYLTLPERDGWRWHRETRQGFVSNVIGEVCKEKDIDLVAMSTRGQDGVVDVFSGTHTQKVIRRVACPVLAIPMK